MATILPPLTDSAEQARGFNPMDFPAGYANDVMHHVIDHNCHGCTIPEPADVAEHGDGGCCGILAAIFVSDNIPELTYDGTTVRCLARLAVGEANE